MLKFFKSTKKMIFGEKVISVVNLNSTRSSYVRLQSNLTRIDSFPAEGYTVYHRTADIGTNQAGVSGSLRAFCLLRLI